jgi:hypothetical protein
MEDDLKVVVVALNCEPTCRYTRQMLCSAGLVRKHVTSAVWGDMTSGQRAGSLSTT